MNTPRERNGGRTLWGVHCHKRRNCIRDRFSEGKLAESQTSLSPANSAREVMTEPALHVGTADERAKLQGSLQMQLLKEAHICSLCRPKNSVDDSRRGCQSGVGRPQPLPYDTRLSHSSPGRLRAQLAAHKRPCLERELLYLARCPLACLPTALSPRFVSLEVHDQHSAGARERSQKSASARRSLRGRGGAPPAATESFGDFAATQSVFVWSLAARCPGDARRSASIAGWSLRRGDPRRPAVNEALQDAGPWCGMCCLLALLVQNACPVDVDLAIDHKVVGIDAGMWSAGEHRAVR
ncbi:unnamed protein product [Lampetra fluviatilis]